MKILAIDDSNTMRILISKSLKEIGYTDVTLCESGALAMNIITNSKFDLVLLDWHMPGINGLEVLKFIKNGKHKNTPVIMLTSEQQKVNIVRAIDSGAADYLIKPLNNIRLKDKIVKILGHNEKKVEKPITEKPDAEKPDAEMSDAEMSDAEMSDTEMSDTEMSDTEMSDTEMSDTEIQQNEEQPEPDIEKTD